MNRYSHTSTKKTKAQSSANGNSGKSSTKTKFENRTTEKITKKEHEKNEGDREEGVGEIVIKFSESERSDTSEDLLCFGLSTRQVPRCLQH